MKTKAKEKKGKTIKLKQTTTTCNIEGCWFKTMTSCSNCRFRANILGTLFMTFKSKHIKVTKMSNSEKILTTENGIVKESERFLNCKL